MAKIRRRNNQVPHLTQDTTCFSKEQCRHVAGRQAGRWAGKGWLRQGRQILFLGLLEHWKDVCLCSSDNTNLITKVKVENFHLQLKSHITKQLLTSITIDISPDISTLKSDIHLGFAAR